MDLRSAAGQGDPSIKEHKILRANHSIGVCLGMEGSRLT